MQLHALPVGRVHCLLCGIGAHAPAQRGRRKAPWLEAASSDFGPLARTGQEAALACTMEVEQQQQQPQPQPPAGGGLHWPTQGGPHTGLQTQPGARHMAGRHVGALDRLHRQRRRASC